MIRRFLVDYARRHRARQRANDAYGSEQSTHDAVEIEVDLRRLVMGADSVSVSVFVEAMEKLAEIDNDASEVFNLRVFGGLASRDIAKDKDRSIRSIQLAYTRARMFLAREVERSIAA
jgi:DNA-directed RNA polymerase specialized sigma24 family protein